MALPDHWYSPYQKDNDLFGDSTSYFFEKGMLKLLEYPQSLTYDFKKISKFFSGVIKSEDDKLRFICYTRWSGGSAGDITYPFIQFKKKNGQLGSYYWNSLHSGSIHKLHSKDKDLYLVMYGGTGNTTNGIYGAIVLQLKGNFLIIDYPAFPNSKSKIHLMCPYGDVIDFDKKNETININLNNGCEFSWFLKDREVDGITNGGNGEEFLNYKEDLKFKLKFDGNKFIQLKK